MQRWKIQRVYFPMECIHIKNSLSESFARFFLLFTSFRNTTFTWFSNSVLPFLSKVPLQDMLYVASDVRNSE